MKSTLAKGLTTKARIDVDRDRTIGFMGEDLRVYATPWMLRDIEQTCRNLLLEHLDEEEDSVGAHVSLDHLGATLVDSWVDISAEITEVDGRRVTFAVEVHDPLEQVGRAHHVRFCVDRPRQKQRLEAKRAKLDGKG